MQLKSFFNHRSASKDAFKTFNHLEDLFRFVTEAYIISLAMKIMSMDSFDGTPKDNTPGSAKKDCKEDRHTFLSNVADRVLSEIWLLPSAEEINKMLEADVNSDVWCFCSEGMYCGMLGQLGLQPSS